MARSEFNKQSVSDRWEMNEVERHVMLKTRTGDQSRHDGSIAFCKLEEVWLHS